MSSQGLIELSTISNSCTDDCGSMVNTPSLPTYRWWCWLLWRYCWGGF